MVSDVDISLGRRIELARRRRGLSREILGDLIGRSSEWIRQVERDDRPVDRLSLLLLLAKVLKVSDVASFLGCAMPAPVRLESPSATTSQLRDLLYQQRFAAPAGVADDARIVELRAELDGIWAAWQCSPHPYTGTLRRLPAFINTLNGLEQTPGVCEQLAGSFRLSCVVLGRLGDLPAALLAGERAIVAARNAKESLTEAACVDAYGATLLRLGAPGQARQLCLDAAADLEERLGEGPPEKISIQGSLLLTAAEAAVADDDHLVGERLLNQARLLAARLGSDRNDYASGFGPTGVQIHAVRISLSLGRVRQALRMAESADVQRIAARERRSRHFITIARAHARQDNQPAVVFALLKAEEVCPEEITFNKEAREVVRGLLYRDNAMIRNEVWALAERTGLA